ncbi:hypothetical protein AnigIFM60653_003290 [Aspergillus niger]|nr:hypothetical protein AnigIFM60653_003290 [Aspergillus niger]
MRKGKSKDVQHIWSYKFFDTPAVKVKCHPSNLGANKNSVPLRPQIQAVLEYAVALLNDMLVVDQVKLLYQQYGALCEAMKEEVVLRVVVGFVS